MAKRIRLSSKEIEAILEVSGDALATEMFESTELTEVQQLKMVEAYERGTNKLREMLARKKLKL